MSKPKYPNIIPRRITQMAADNIASGLFEYKAMPPDSDKTPAPTRFLAIDAISEGMVAVPSNLGIAEMSINEQLLLPLSWDFTDPLLLHDSGSCRGRVP